MSLFLSGYCKMQKRRCSTQKMKALFKIAQDDKTPSFDNNGFFLKKKTFSDIGREAYLFPIVQQTEEIRSIECLR